MDRKQSPLVTQAAPWTDDPPGPVDQPQESPESTQENQQETASAPPGPRGELPTLPSTGKRKRAHRKLGPFDRRGFNANLPVVVVRGARKLAVHWDCDQQDVVEVALLRLFEAEGIEIPRTQADYDRMIRDGRL